MIDVDAHAERVRERQLPAAQLQRLRAECGGEHVREDRHGSAVRSKIVIDTRVDIQCARESGSRRILQNAQLRDDV